jgi:sugar phosphate isomerase/epimerase
VNELSVLITSLPGAAEIAIAEIARLGFQHIDLVGKAKRPEPERQALADTGLIVDCVALGRDLPEACTLDAADLDHRRRAVDEVKLQIAEAAQIGARIGYVVPCKQSEALPAFADSCQTLAVFAHGRKLQLCVEHFPGSALPTAASTLDWLQGSGLENIKLVLDLGHCLISREDPSALVEQAGARLGSVQLDDNDGANDVHWPLLSGALKEDVLRGLLHRLREQDIHGGIALELNGKLNEPLGNLVTSRQVVELLWKS